MQSFSLKNIHVHAKCCLFYSALICWWWYQICVGGSQWVNVHLGALTISLSNVSRWSLNVPFRKPCIYTLKRNGLHFDEIVITSSTGRCQLPLLPQICVSESGQHWFRYSSPSHYSTLKHRETHGCVVSTVATNALVLKHQAISILSSD